MAGEQEIFVLGLDISSFSPANMAVLKEYLAMFDALAKYDGKVINPVMGDGMTKLNQSMVETTKLLEVISLKLSNLNTNFVMFADKAEQAFDKPAIAATKYIRVANQAADATKRVAKTQEEFKTQVGGTVTTLEGVGKGLTSLLTNLRYLAFILPGIGIAGIFNLAYEAIGKLLDGLIDFEHLFESSYDAAVRHSTDLNESTLKLIDNLEKVNEILKDIYASSTVGLPGYGEDQFKVQNDILAGLKAEGEERGKILNQEVALARLRKETAEKSIFAGRSEEFVIQVSKQLDKMTELSLKISEAKQAISTFKPFITPSGIPGVPGGVKLRGEDDINKTIKLYQSQYDLIAKNLALNQKDLEEYNKASVDYANKEKERTKFLNDEARKEFIETEKLKVAVTEESQRAILGNDTKFYDAKKAALDKQLEDAVEKNKLAEQNILENNSSTDAEIAIAKKKRLADDVLAQSVHDEKLRQLQVDTYQRFIRATSDTKSKELDAIAVANQKIYENTNNSLEERLAAYQKYIEARQKQVSIEFNLGIQKGAKGPGQPTALTPEEQNDLISKAVAGKSNIVANGEKQIYDIVYSSVRKQIDAVKDGIAAEDDINKQGYITALNGLNDRYDKGVISLKQYHEERQKIDDYYAKELLDREIAKATDDLRQLQELHDKKIAEEILYQEQLLTIAELYAKKHIATPEDVEKAKAGVAGAKKGDTELDKDIADTKRKLQDLEEARAKLGPGKQADQNAKEWKEWVDQAVRAEEAINKIIGKLEEDRIKHKERMIERQKQLIDSEYEHEQAAVEKSTLTLKDKQALEIRLAEEKAVYDENAQLKKYRLEVEEFNFNKKLQLANAAVGIAAAIIKDGITSPKSLADVIIGAAQIAAILATQPPSFEKGVDYFKGGFARYGEAGPEIIKKPGQAPVIAMGETISYLPEGTKIIPLRSEHPEFGDRPIDNSWEQTRFLARQIKKSNKEVKNIFKPNIVVDLSFYNRKRQILGN